MSPRYYYLHKKSFSYINSSSTRTARTGLCLFFCISQPTVSRIIITWINSLAVFEVITFSNQQYYNTFKGLTGISPDGVIIFKHP